jgi:hypothetical protein
MARTYGMRRLKEGIESGLVALGAGAARNVVGVKGAASIAAGKGASASAVQAQETALINQPTPPGLYWLDAISFLAGVGAEVAGAALGMPALGELGEGAWIPATAYGGEDLALLVRRKAQKPASSSTSSSSSNVRVLDERRGGTRAAGVAVGAGYGGYDANFDSD